AQFRHGPLELAGPTLAAAIVATEPATEALDRGLASELAEAGASVLLLLPKDERLPGVDVVAVGDLHPQLAPAVAAVRCQLLGWRLAGARGWRPGTLGIAWKVTTRECRRPPGRVDVRRGAPEPVWRRPAVARTHPGRAGGGGRPSDVLRAGAV